MSSAPSASEVTPTTATTTQEQQPMSSGQFHDLDADADVERLNEMESLCMQCYENGTTRMLLTKIPYFRDIIVMSFECPHCHWRNTETQPANSLADKGVSFTLKVDTSDAKATVVDLNRQVIKSETATIKVPELEFEIPPNPERGEINTLEGILRNAADALESTYVQSTQAGFTEENVEKVKVLITAFRAMAGGERDFTFSIDDPSGNSFVENPKAPHMDPRCVMKSYTRTKEQTEFLGYAEQKEDESEPASNYNAQGEVQHSKAAKAVTIDSSVGAKLDTFFDVTERSAVIPGDCPSCDQQCETRMCVTDIPYFKEVIIMATDCAGCGYKDSEVKPAGAISKQGVRLELKVEGPADLARDVLKSDMGGIQIPELELEMMAGTLGGKYTTLEGILQDMYEQLRTVHAFHLGDSARHSLEGKDEVTSNSMTDFLVKLQECVTGSRPFTFVLDDPLGNSFIDNLHHPEPDHQMTKTLYERSYQQNEDLGLNDMQTENYNPAMPSEEAVTEGVDNVEQVPSRVFKDGQEGRAKVAAAAEAEAEAAAVEEGKETAQP